MPITAWICNVECGGREVSLDHFQKTDCGLRVHPDYANAVLNSRNGHYVRGVVEVSMGLGCPRSSAIQQAKSYACDPLSQNAPETGTAWHAHMEANSVDRENCEVRLTGAIEGIQITGKTDRLHPERGIILDWKHQNDWAAKWNAEKAKPEHRVQVSVYGELARQTRGVEFTTGVVLYHYSQGGKKAVQAHSFSLLPVAEALGHRPYSGEYSVRELYKQAEEHFVGGRSWQELPLAGESMRFGDNTACDYCAVRELCFTQARSAPF